MRRDAVHPAALHWPVTPVALPLLYAWLAWAWWGEIRTQLAALPETAAQGLDLMAAAATAGRIPGVLSEAGLYALWWRMRGLALPYWRFACWIATLSAIDLLGFSVRRVAAEAAPALHAIGVALAGPAAAGAPADGMTAAFGSFGALTVMRIVMTAWAQARGLGRSLGGPLLLTASAWLVTRVIAWWSVDLLRGASPLP